MAESSNSSNNNNKQSFGIKDLKCQKVVVFTDRAEVKRVLKTKLKKGENEVTLTGVTSSIDQDSVRVEGHGNATVVDVVCQTKAVTEFKGLDSADSKIKELKSEIKSLEEQIERQRQKLQRNERQTSILNDFAATLSKPVSGGNNGSGQINLATLNSQDNVNNFINFLGTYTTKVETLDAEKLELKKEIKELEDKLAAANDNLNRQVGYETYTTSTDVNILLEAAADDSEVELLISYLVYSASWTPKYDIRVFSKEKTMNINYFGMISQSTGEDWNDVKLSLSTAVPSIGGNVPELETQNVRVRVPVVYQPPMQLRGRVMMSKRVEADEECMLECDSAMPQAMAFAAAPRLQMAVAEVAQSNVGSTATFDIARNSTIPSDSNTHKVSIGLISLQPEFEYQTVPRKNSHAYLKARVVNKSQFPLLAGPANVFLDQNFVSKIDLKSYSPQEEFDCSLGVDPGIRIDYKPVRKFKSESGLISKSTSTTYQQEIEVKNTTPNAAKILLCENLPLSNDDKIQVKLVEPSLKNNSNVKLNKKNNLEFELNIGANKTENVVIKYSVDHPSDKEIEFF